MAMGQAPSQVCCPGNMTDSFLQRDVTKTEINTKAVPTNSVLLGVSDESLAQPIMQVLHSLCTQTSHVKGRALSVKAAQY